MPGRFTAPGRRSCSTWPRPVWGASPLQSVSDYQQAAEERAFMRAVVTGLADLDAGREVSFSEAKARFDFG